MSSAAFYAPAVHQDDDPQVRLVGALTWLQGTVRAELPQTRQRLAGCLYLLTQPIEHVLQPFSMKHCPQPAVSAVWMQGNVFLSQPSWVQDVYSYM